MEQPILVQTPARAGIVGNPSDGFFGKTLSIPIRNFSAKIFLFEWEEIEILPGVSDEVVFPSIEHLIADIEINGYYGGIRLIKAAIKQFYEYTKAQGIDLQRRNFNIRYTTNIPRQVGLAGSSAIITSTMKALCQFFGVEIEKPVLPNIVLWSETKELGIAAGLQDRVVEVYNEPVFMDFNEAQMAEYGYGIYQPVDSALFPPMYIAYQVNLTHPDVVHNDVRARWDRGDETVRSVMADIAQNGQDGYDALVAKNIDVFNRCVDRNYDLRASIYNISPKNAEMIRLARETGATASFPGSGGAVVGTYADEAMFDALEDCFRDMGCEIIKVSL
jgi:glucuronokinase